MNGRNETIWIMLLALIILILIFFASHKCIDVPNLEDIKKECADSCLIIIEQEREQLVNDLVEELSKQCLTRDDIEEVLEIVLKVFYNKSYVMRQLEYKNVFCAKGQTNK